MMHNEPFVGKGLYTVRDADRLTDVPSVRIRRWLTGRKRLYRGNEVFDEPLWEPDLGSIEGGLHLTFRDLIELRIVDQFRKKKLSLPYLRKVVSAAQDIVGDSHPFSTSNFKTDGRRLYLEIINSTGDAELIEILSGQHAFHSIISVGLKDVSFLNGVAARWTPSAGRGAVVLDPARAFGHPILEQTGVPTQKIAELRRSGISAKKIASDFEVSLSDINKAIAFENELAA